MFFPMLVLLKCFRLKKEKVNKKDIIAPSHLIAKPSHPPNPFQPDRFLTQDFFCNPSSSCGRAVAGGRVGSMQALMECGTGGDFSSFTVYEEATTVLDTLPHSNPPLVGECPHARVREAGDDSTPMRQHQGEVARHGHPHQDLRRRRGRCAQVPPQAPLERGPHAAQPPRTRRAPGHRGADHHQGR
jgi:hypothetical protein